MSELLGKLPWCVSCRGNQKPGEFSCPRCNNAAWKVPIPEATTMQFFEDYFLAGMTRTEFDVEWAPCVCINVGINPQHLSAEQYLRMTKYGEAGYVITKFPEFPVLGTHALSPIFYGDLKIIIRRMHADTGIMRSLARIGSQST